MMTEIRPVVAPAAQWHEEHARFSRLLDLMEPQLAALHDDKQPDYDVMRDVVHYLRNFADRFHHPREDVAFARLVARDESVRLLVSRLAQEHRVIATAGEELLERLDDILAGALVQRTAVEAAASTYLVYYRHHMATEETEIIPRAIDLLTPDDWSAVAAAVPSGPDPLLGDNFEARYEALRRLVLSETQGS